MGESVHLHQGRLDSFVSCRCDDRSIGTRYQQEEDTRSELSYAEPKDPNASPATPPSSALMENTPSPADPTSVNPHWPLRTAEDWARFREAEAEDQARRELEFRRGAAELPSPSVWHDVLSGAPSSGSDYEGRLVEIEDKAEDAPAEVSSSLFPSCLGNADKDLQNAIPLPVIPPGRRIEGGAGPSRRVRSHASPRIPVYLSSPLVHYSRSGGVVRGQRAIRGASSSRRHHNSRLGGHGSGDYQT